MKFKKLYQNPNFLAKNLQEFFEGEKPAKAFFFDMDSITSSPGSKNKKIVSFSDTEERVKAFQNIPSGVWSIERTKDLSQLRQKSIYEYCDFGKYVEVLCSIYE